MKIIWILDQNYQQIGVIDTYVSLIWSTRYNDIGECEMCLACTKDNIELLQKNYYLLRDDDDMVCRIEHITIETDAEDGNYLVVKAYDCRKILNQRIILGTLTFNGTVEDLIRKFIADNITSEAAREDRRIGNIVLGERRGFEDVFDGQVSWDQLFDKVQELSEAYGYGSKMTLSNGVFTFHLYKGVDRSAGQNENDAVIFSPEYENLSSTEYSYDGEIYKNCYISAGEGEGEERVWVVKEDANLTGMDRYELYVDARDISSSVSFEDLTEIFPENEIRERKTGEKPTLKTDADISDLKYVMIADGNIVAFLDSKPADSNTPGTCIMEEEPYKGMLAERGIEKLAECKCESSFEGEVTAYKYREDYGLGDIVTVENGFGISCDARITEVIESFEDNEEKAILTLEYQLDDSDMGDYILSIKSEIITTEGGVYIER